MDLFIGLVALFFFFNYFFIFIIFKKILILITLFYLFVFFLSFVFLPFLLSRVADRVLMLRQGVRPEALRWESQVQDSGQPETSWPHIISIVRALPEITVSALRPRSTQ